jgi:hypothetical protein
LRIIRYETKQGHPVPKSAMAPRGPFPPELFRDPEIITDYVPQSDGGGEEIPEGGTAQNNFRELRWFKCRVCGDIVSEHEVDSHICDDIEEDEEDDGYSS